MAHGINGFATDAFLRRLDQRGKTDEVLSAIYRTVRTSLQTHPPRHLTDDERKRRLAFCLDFAQRMSGAKGWGLQRTLDTMGDALTARLDHRPWEPDNRSIWVAGDGAII